MTEMLYLHDHYLKEFDAVIVEVPNERALVLDKTAFYPKGGGQPSDHGTLTVENDSTFRVIESSKDQGRILHSLESSIPPSGSSALVGQRVKGYVDWELRYKHMRHHTALHILSGVVYHKFSSRITGGQIYPDRARLDFTLDDLSKERLQVIESEMNRIVSEDRPVKTYWLTTDEAIQKKELYRLSADLLPKSLEKLRIVDIEGFDAQLDGGTHVAKTGEIGWIRISKTENKGKDNKRIEIVLSSP